MNKIHLSTCTLDSKKLKDIISIGIFGSYHEKVFDKNRSDIDIAILSDKELDFDIECEIEDYLNSILPTHFNHENIHYTFINGFIYPFSELLLMSNDKLIFNTEKFLDYTLGYSCFKRDRENLEIIREENLKDLERYKNGLL